jgi:23S rRNA pseudouridine2604 synthase
MRINKYLALKGHSTRRDADILIQKGQVFINNTLAVLGDKVTETDVVDVRFRGKPKQYRYIAYNKPRGIITHSANSTNDDIADIFPVKDVFPVGRLDKDSYGLIILTNDGRITERLLGPSQVHEKEYVVTTHENLRGSFKEKMERGVQIEKEKTKKCRVTIVNDKTFKIILTEGKKHQIRRMCVALFQSVKELKRTRIMNIMLGTLQPGAYREIVGEELDVFLKSLGLGSV